VGTWESATVEITAGTHAIESADAFGALAYGYAVEDAEFEGTGYGYPIGLSTMPLVIP
jgi:hypothetical protein